MLDQVTSVLKAIAIASQLGLGPVATAYTYSAFLPRIFRTVVGGAHGAVHSTLGAVLVSEPESKRTATLVAVSGVLLVTTTTACILVWQLAPALVVFLAGGVSKATLQIAVSQLQIMAPVLIIAGQIGVATSLHGLQGSLGTAVASPALINLTVVLAMLLYHYQTYGKQLAADGQALDAHAADDAGPSISNYLAISTVIGTALQLLLLWCTVSRSAFQGAWEQLRLPELSIVWKRAWFMAFRMGSVLVLSMVDHVGLLVDLFLASFMPAGTAAALSYAYILASAPFSMLTQSLLASLPAPLAAPSTAFLGTLTSVPSVGYMAGHSGEHDGERQAPIMSMARSNSCKQLQSKQLYHWDASGFQQAGPAPAQGALASAPGSVQSLAQMSGGQSAAAVAAGGLADDKEKDPEAASCCGSDNDSEDVPIDPMASCMARVCESGLQVALPTSAILFALALPLAELCFVRGSFDKEAANMVAPLVSMYGLAGTTYVLQEVLLRFGHACLPGSEAFKLTTIAAMIKLSCSSLLCAGFRMGPEALALSTLLSSASLAAMLTWHLRRHFQLYIDFTYVAGLVWYVACAAASACIARIYNTYVTEPLCSGGSYIIKMVGLMVDISAGLAVYLIMALGV